MTTLKKSLILTGTCSKCGNKFHVAFGDAQWFGPVMTGKVKPYQVPEWDDYMKVLTSKTCPTCLSYKKSFRDNLIIKMYKKWYVEKVFENLKKTKTRRKLFT